MFRLPRRELLFIDIGVRESVEAFLWEEQTYGRLGLTQKTIGRLEANWKVKTRICCLQYFYILAMEWIYDVLEEILVFQILEEWKLGILWTVFYHWHCYPYQYFVTLNNIVICVFK